MNKRHFRNLLCSLLLPGTFFTANIQAQESLFEYVGPPDSVSMPEHVTEATRVKINRRALQAASLSIELSGQVFIADRSSIDKQKSGQLVWIGQLRGSGQAGSVIITLKGNVVSGMIQNGAEMYRIGESSAAGSRLFHLDLLSLPPDDAGDLPEGEGAPATQESSSTDGNTQQDLLVVYNQAACSFAGSCAQLQADIVTAVADINSAYNASGVNITMNLIGSALTSYTGTSSSQALSDLRGTSDGKMDEIHTLRDDLGADIVAFVYDGEGCGRGYINSSASTAFSVTDVPCLVGNRTMAHEIGHNQGAHHDRVSVGGGTSGAYNYGYRRCDSNVSDNYGSPYYRTFMAYPCGSTPRLGLVSNPNFSYLGVPQGIDPAADPARGAWNARTLNESASYISGFRATAATTVPTAPSGLSAQGGGLGKIDLSWQDNASDENSFVVESSQDDTNWSAIATLAPDSTSHTDDGLLPDTIYFYRVMAVNGAGSSGYTATASHRTDPLPVSIPHQALSEQAITGFPEGDYQSTWSADSSIQTLLEDHAGGPKRRRKQSYQHAWEFDVYGGAGGVIASVNAWVSGSEGANFYYSLDGGASRTFMFTVSNSSQGADQTFTLPTGTSGPVRIEVQDAAQENGEAIDSVSIDYLAITSYTSVGEPPTAPTGLGISAFTDQTVTLQFQDTSDDELGFEIWRSGSSPADCNAGTTVATLGANAGNGEVTHEDTTVTPETAYWYWAKSFNAAGDSGLCSNVETVTTAQATAPPLSLTIDRTYKVKGVKHVDLVWTGIAGEKANVHRLGGIIVDVPNTGAYTDNLEQKGGGAHTYKVCKSDNSICTPEKTAVF